MLDFGIPGDGRELRKSIFAKLMTPDPETGYMDGEDYGLMRPFVKDNNLDLETRLWLAFLYGLSYSCTTTMRFLAEFPTIADLKPKKLDSFWAEKKSTLWFQPDKRYLQNNDQVVPAIRHLRKRVGINLSQYLVPFLEQGFDATYKEITKNWRYFGPMGAYLFFDALYAFVPELYTDPATLDWKNMGRTVGEGMAHLLGRDLEAIGQSPFNTPRYDAKVEKLVKQFGCPKIVIESNLCFFRKLFKGTRYLGYYADRQLVECTHVETRVEKEVGVDIWDYRMKTTPDELRGEVGGWSGIRKDRYKIFLTTGTLMGVEE